MTEEQKIEQAESPVEQQQQQQPQQAEEQQQQQQPQQEQQPIVEASEQQQEPDVIPAHAADGGREVSHKILYVANLTKTITEESLEQFFDVNKSNSVTSVKILIDKNRLGFNYAFVEFVDEAQASAAFESLNGSLLDGAEIKINWAYQSQQGLKDQEAYNVFVGDLSTDVNDEFLKKTFERYPSLLQAHVMWDMQSGRSRGYGFISFAEQKDAENAIQTMNGEVVAGRAIRLNWASHKQQQYGNNGHGHHHNNHHGHNNHPHNNGYRNNYHHHNNFHYSNGNGNGAMNGNGNLPTPQNSAGGIANSPLPIPLSTNGAPDSTLPVNGNGNGAGVISPQSYDLILRKAPSWLTTVYIGNLAHYTTQNELIPLLQNFGYIVDLKFYPEKGCAFVKYDSHERAALAIVQLQGFVMNGRPLKSGWGRSNQNQGHHHHGNHHHNNVQHGVPIGQFHPAGVYGGIMYPPSQGR